MGAYVFKPELWRASYENIVNRLERLKRRVAERTQLEGDALLNAHWACVSLVQESDPIAHRLAWRQSVAFLVKWKKHARIVKRDGLFWAAP